MIKGVFAGGIAAALGFAGLLPAVVTAKGSGPHRSHVGPGFFAKSALRHHHHAFRHRHRQFGNVLAGYSYVMPDAHIEPEIDAAFPINFIASPVVRCHHSRETVTVPSEDGGTREITITRC